MGVVRGRGSVAGEEAWLGDEYGYGCGMWVWVVGVVRDLGEKAGEGVWLVDE